MKNIVAIIPVILLFACTKNNSVENMTAISGKWNIINDTSYTGVGATNHVVGYAGKSGDYFNFNTDGKLSIEENGKLNVLNYTLTSNSIITIDSFLSDATGVPEPCTITNLSSHDVVISTVIAETPGGTFGRKVHLSR